MRVSPQMTLAYFLCNGQMLSLFSKKLAMWNIRIKFDFKSQKHNL